MKLTLTALFFFLFTLIGCCPQVIENTTLRVDTLEVPYLNTDTLYLVRDSLIYRASTPTIDLKIDTLYKKAYFRVKDTIYVQKIDTIHTTEYVITNSEDTIWTKLGRVATGFVIGVIIILGTLIFFRR